MMQKVKSVIKKSLFILIILSNSLIVFSQDKIKGKYSVVDETGYFFTNYYFSEKGTFIYSSGGDLGVSNYGKGHYFIKKDSLFLNYDLTELKENSYHRTKEYYNSKDSIQIKLNIYNFSKKPLHKIQVWSFPNYKSEELDTNGVALFKFKKEKRKDKLEIHLDGEYYAKHVINLNYNINYEIDVFMSKTDNYGFGHSKAYKNDVKKYKIIEFNKESIKLEDKNGIVIWRKEND
ncbi:hypothetical protein Lupro_09165 [Lutibacter profundi]|uniref:Uncharacterized protein n=2 Tax=Lutibacter profundi TaxID=1622118 RepID=A0A0X8G7G8_9FLAO|nr:hypothetical protein Lupro_09165 [Lutibacter profundi]